MVPHCHELRFFSGCHTKLVQPLKLLLVAVNNPPVSPTRAKVFDQLTRQSCPQSLLCSGSQSDEGLKGFPAQLLLLKGSRVCSEGLSKTAFYLLALPRRLQHRIWAEGSDVER